MLKKSLSFSQKDLFPDMKLFQAKRRVAMMGFRHRPDEYDGKTPKSSPTKGQRDESPGSKIE